jgi:hypothetical protein
MLERIAARGVGRRLNGPTGEKAMKQQPTSPRITSITWGRLKIEDGSTYRDAKLYPGGSREWNWRETGTSHHPGIQMADVRELLDHGARVVILSRGMNGNLQVKPGTLEALKKKGVTCHVLQTEEAVRRYNEIRERLPVGGLFHSTC